MRIALIAVFSMSVGTVTALGPVASATVINVPGDQPTIQAGINAAVNGDTVLVAAGNYNEAIVSSGKAITVESAGGAAVTIIDATGLSASVLRLNASGGSGTTLWRGFAITGGQGTTLDSFTRVGAGVYSVGGHPTFVNCEIVGNELPTAPQQRFGGGIYLDGAMTLINCSVRNNRAVGTQGHGGGMYCTPTSTPIAIDTTFSDNMASGIGFMVIPGSGSGGGVVAGLGTFVKCIIRGNLTAGTSSAIGGGARGGSLFINCEITNNDLSSSPSPSGAGVASDGAFINCTISLNGSPGAGVAGNSPSLMNCIVFGNLAGQVTATALVVHSCIQGGFAGDGNVDADPLFIDAANGDFRLQDGSPCRDIGDRTLLPADTHDLDGDTNTAESLSRDLDGVRRIVNGQVDMGAYEWQRSCLTDISRTSPGVAGDGITNIGDLLAVIAGWGPCDQCNADVNNDDVVNIADLLLVIAGWGACP